VQSVTTRLPIFLNPGAGRGAAAEADALRAAFIEAGAEPVIHILEGDPRIPIREAVTAGAPVIGVAGGDGTISAAANAIAGSQSALLPIPLGTLNHFSIRYGIPTAEAAVLAWRRASVEAVHVGSVNDRIFVNNTSCGFYPHMVRHREKLERFLPRVPAMWIAGLRVLIEMPMLRLHVQTDVERHDARTPALWVGIGRNSLRLPIPGDAEVNDVVLEAVWGRAKRRTSIIALSFRLLAHLKKGMEPRDAALDVVRTRTFILHSERPIDIALDGEPFRLETPLKFEIRESALRVVVLVAPAV
jgi:diacylglycerol kinase family enzyme